MTTYRVVVKEFGLDVDVDSLDQVSTTAVFARHPALREQLRHLRAALCMDRFHASVAVLDAAGNIIEVIEPILFEGDF